MDAGGDDGRSENSDNMSSQTGGTGASRLRNTGVGVVVGVGTKVIEEKPVSKLRPKKPLMLQDSLTVFESVELMASRRADAALLVNSEGQLSGIITDNDVTRRVVAQFLDPLTTPISTVMTANPKCVHSDDSALDALELMVDNHFRHLPVCTFRTIRTYNL